MTTVQELNKYKFYLFIDKSGSMSTNDCDGGKSRWDSVQESTKAIAEKINKLSNGGGINIITFNNSIKIYADTTPDKVDQIFVENEPMGGTSPDKALKVMFDDYFTQKAAGTAKPVIGLVVTDGEPSSEEDKNNLTKLIVDSANKMDADEEIGISFFQVGKDPDATKFLQFLDDNLVSVLGAKFDIVDTKKMTDLENMSLTDAIMEAIKD